MSAKISSVAKALSIVFILLLLSPLINNSDILAQTIPVDRPPIFNVATTFNYADDEIEEIVDGDILSLVEEPQLLTRSRVAYDEKMYGIATENPMMVYRTWDTLPVVRSGEAYVNVTTINGPLEIGDYVTSSPLPGKGQKATDMSKYMVGIALSSLTEENGTPFDYEDQTIHQGKVRISVGIGPASPVQVQGTGGIFGTFRSVVTSLLFNLQSTKEGARIIRYILAALVAALTIFVNFFTFGRNITKGIESIGRNPLAKISIQSMIVLNLVLIAVTTIGGIILSLAIISL